MPQYRLQTVLELRERAEEAAKEAFAAAMRALAEAQAEQKRMEDDLARRKRERADKVAAYLADALKKGSAANAFQNLSRFEARLRDEEAALAEAIERQKELVRQKHAEAEQKRAEMAEATKEKKAIEKHKETWQKQVKHERDVREENNQDEIGSALFLARGRDQTRRSGGEE
jgi:flagellar export protein FliJ